MYTFVLVLKILVKLVKFIGANIPLPPLFRVSILCNPGWSSIYCVSWGWLWMPHLSPSSSQVLILQGCTAIHDYSWKKLTEGRQQPSPNLPMESFVEESHGSTCSFLGSQYLGGHGRKGARSWPACCSLYNSFIKNVFYYTYLGEIWHSGTVACMGIGNLRESVPSTMWGWAILSTPSITL